MKTGFPNPIDNPPKKEKPSKLAFTNRPYDERSSCFVKAGCDYGVGYKQPVGHHGEPKKEVPCLPFGRVNTVSVDSHEGY